MSQLGDVDPFAHIDRVCELASEIEGLAAEYVAATEPLRTALNVILQADPDERFEMLYHLGPQLRGLKLAESGYGSEINTTGTPSPPSSLAAYVLRRMSEAGAEENREHFDKLLASMRAKPTVAEAARAAFKTFAGVILTRCYRSIGPGFAERVSAAFAGAKMKWWWASADDFKIAGTPLSTRANVTLCYLLDPLAPEAWFNLDGLLVPVGWRAPVRDDACEEPHEIAESGNGRKDPASATVFDMQALLIAIKAAELKGKEAEVVTLIAEQGGQVLLADAKLQCNGADVESAYKRAKPKLKNQGWELYQHDNRLCAKPLPRTGRK